jgi:hypothetical protein
MALAVREEREPFALWLHRKDEESREESRRNRRDTETIIAECKIEANRSGWK